MSNKFKTAAIAAFSFISLAAFGGSGAFGASDIADTNAGSLLPHAVMEAAREEGETPVDHSHFPDMSARPESAGPDQREPVERRNAGSLASLVSQQAGVATRNREEECLAGAVYFEAKSESLEGQLAVARVIINRAQSGRFPGSLCGVVFQPGQFSFVRGSGFPPIARSGRDWQEAVAIARIARDGLWQSPVPKALFFHARHVSPGWRLTRIATVGNHVFYR